MKYNFEQAIQAVQTNQLAKAKEILIALEKTLSNDPHYWNLRAVIAVQEKDFKTAVIFFQKALTIKKDDINFLKNIAICYKNLQQYQNAEQALQKAVELGEKDTQILYQLANYSNMDFKFDKAIAYYQQILALQPDNDKILFELTGTYQLIRKTQQGIAYLKQLQKKSNNKELINVFIASLRLWEKDWSYYQQDINTIKQDTIKQLATTGAMPHIAAFTALFYLDDKKLNLQITKIFSGYKPNKVFQHKPDVKQKNKKLRIGYVSDDFRDHPVAHLCKRLFEYMNKLDTESYLYAHGGDDKSEYRKHFEQTATQFIDVAKLSYLEVAELIYKDNIDILIDMKGQTTNSILPMFAYKPAPIQIAYLGYPGTTGADYIDYIIVDKTIAPLVDQQYFTEKFIYMPHCYQVNDNQQFIAQEKITKAQCHLPEDKFIYCCFNNSYKIEPTIFTIWMNILKSVPDSVLWLLTSTPEENAALQTYAKEHGVNVERIIFAEKKPKAQHLRRLQLADLFLDTYVVGAHTTASDSLWAGVPILTCTGDRFVSRVCTSLLNTQGLTELITDNLEAYQQKAIYYGQNPKEIKKLKEKIQQTNKTMPLFNTELYAKFFAKALRLAWERYCDGLPPEVIKI